MKDTISKYALTITGVALIAAAPSSVQAAIVGSVQVLQQVNDGSLPPLCTGNLNASAGGVAELAMDLDQDGTVDVCFGSISNNCAAGFNYDAFTLNGTLLSTEDGSGMMGGVDATLAGRTGDPVGPNFQAASGSISSANIGVPDEPMVFGFKGGSSTATTEVGMFSFTVDSADCSITFGKVDYKTGTNTYDASVVGGAPSATSVLISGTAQVGQTLTGSYTYSDDESDPEDASATGTSFRFVRSTDTDVTTTGDNADVSSGSTGGTSQAYTAQDADLDAYIFYCVTPRATSGVTEGTETCSSAVGPIAAQAAPAATSVPTLSQWGVVILSAILAISAGLARRRQPR